MEGFCLQRKLLASLHFVFSVYKNGNLAQSTWQGTSAQGGDRVGTLRCLFWAHRVTWRQMLFQFNSDSCLVNPHHYSPRLWEGGVPKGSDSSWLYSLPPITWLSLHHPWLSPTPPQACLEHLIYGLKVDVMKCQVSLKRKPHTPEDSTWGSSNNRQYPAHSCWTRAPSLTQRSLHVSDPCLLLGFTNHFSSYLVFIFILFLGSHK